MTAHPLDNPVWHALVGPHAGFAIGSGAARHYPRDITPFSAIVEPTAAAYADLAADLPAGLEARLFRPIKEPALPGWGTISARPITQMVLDNPGDLSDWPVGQRFSRSTATTLATCALSSIWRGPVPLVRGR